MRLRWGRPDLTDHEPLLDLPEPEGADGPSVTFGGVSTLLFAAPGGSVLIDGFFTRPGLVRVATRRIGPDPVRVRAGLERLRAHDVAAVAPVHSHYDHALDAAYVARETGADLVGGESTANLGRGAGLTADRIAIQRSGDACAYAGWTLTHVASRHCPPDRFPGMIAAPLRPPARASAWRCGEAWSIHVRHASGRAALVQGSAGFVPGALDGLEAEVVYLGVGQLGIHPESYLHDYWQHVVRAVGARAVVLTHWDDFFAPADRPLRANAYAVDDLDRSVAVLSGLGELDGVGIHLPRIWRREDPWRLVEQP